MSLYVDDLYAKSIGSKLHMFRHLRDYTYVFRCVVCGDSDISSRKTRGYFYKKTNSEDLRVCCHNCGYHSKFSYFLYEYFPDEYKNYKLEKFKDSATSSKSVSKRGIDAIPDAGQKKEKKLKKIREPKKLEWCDRLDKLPKTHQAYRYCESRSIPVSSLDQIYSTPNFQSFVHANWPHTKETFEKLPQDKRIVFLLKNEKKNIFGLQGRAIGESDLRYITIKVNDEPDCKLFGLERLDKSKKHIVFEGAIDSLFFPNALALCGGDIGTSRDFVDPDRAIYALDNEPRSQDTLNRMEAGIEAGLSVVFWPQEHFSGLKDVNDMILSGFSRKFILQQILDNTQSGLAAKLTFSKWRKR